MKRRAFMQSAALLAASGISNAALAATGDGEPPKEKARVKRYGELGKTGLRISDISFGAGRLTSSALILRAMDRGMNYFDTAPDYGQSEDHIGEALAKSKGRDKVHIASKYCQYMPYTAGKSHLQVGSTQAEYIAVVESSLKRLKTDYLDTVFVHALGESTDFEKEKGRLLDPEMLAATETLKKAGKIRFLAASSHGPNHMEALMTEAVRSGHFDYIMPAFNFMKFPKVPEVLKEAKARGVGVVAMKVLAGAKEGNMTFDAGQFEQAAFKWALSHPEVNGLVITIQSAQDLDLYLPASGQPLTASDQKVLDHYAALYDSDYCRTGCGDCLGACERGVDVASILRYQMYFADYGDEKRAMLSYAALDTNGSACAGCADATCEQACPHRLPIRSKLEAAHRSLNLPFVA
ncbi:MAG: aldo/keto reductase [Magnetococcales bacterium]|nr:aldo/keto reductase [Magnetococcales bacterium]